MTFARVLTNKTVLTGLENSFLKESSLFKPVFGDAGKMGKVIAAAPSLVSSKIQGGFRADINSMLSLGPAGIGGPSNILKKFVR